MSEHTPTPWATSEMASGVTDDNGRGIAICSPTTAALIVKAVNSHDALLEFFKWAMREGPWDGCDLDGAAVQDKAESLGLIVKTQYDAEKHGVQSDFEDGDDWFEYAPNISAPVGTLPDA